MATLSWTSTGSGNWTDPANWSATPAPTSGDTAYVSMGVPIITGAISNESIWLNYSSPANAQLNLGSTAASATLEAGTFLGIDAAANTTLFVTNTDTNNGSIQFGDSAAGTLRVYLGGGVPATLDNEGLVSIDGNFAALGAGMFVNGAAGTVKIVNHVHTALVGSFGGSAGQHVVNNGLIAIDGTGGAAVETVASFSTIGGTGTIALTNAAVLVTGSTAAGSSFDFLDGNGLLTLNVGAGGFASTITGFRAGDTIGLGASLTAGLVVVGESFAPGGAGAPGTLHIMMDLNGAPVADDLLTFAGSYQGSEFALNTLSAGGVTDYTLTTTSTACYRAGTRIRAEAGEIAVEALRVGDRVASAFGGMREVVWLGHRRVDCRHHPRPAEVWPVRVAAGAFGAAMPSRDLWLSPDHAVYVDGVLVPIRCLVNHTTIVRAPMDDVTYWHVELARHDVLLAENLPAESFLDTGNRTAFIHAGPAVQLFPDFAQRQWDGEACAPLVVAGARLKQVRARLRRVAAATPATARSGEQARR